MKNINVRPRLRSVWITVLSLIIFNHLLIFSQNSQNHPLLLFSDEREFMEHMESMPIYDYELYDYHARELDEIYEYAVKNKNGNLLLAIAKKQLGLRSTRSDHYFLENYFSSLLSSHNHFLSDTHQAELLLYLASSNVQTKKYDQAEKSLETLFSLTKKPAIIAAANMLEGSIAKFKGQMDKALLKYFQAEEYFSTSNNLKMQITLLSDIGLIFLELKDLEKSLNTFAKAEELAINLEKDLSMGSFYGNLGSLYQKNKEYDKAYANFQKTLDIAHQLKDRKLEAKTLQNLGNLKKSKEEYDEALALFNRSLEICRASNIEYGLIMNFASKGETYLLKGDYGQSQLYLDSALLQCNKLELKPEKKEILALLGTLAAKKGEFEKAYDISEERISLHELVFNLTQNQRLDELKIQYETRLKDQELELQATQLAREKNRNILLTFAMVFLLFSLFGIYYFLSYKHNKLKTIYSINLAMLNKRERLEKEILNGPQPLSNPREIEEEDYVQDMNEEEIEKYQSLFAEIQSLMSKQQIFKDPNLSIATIADMLNSNTTYVSRAINTFAKINFNSYVNEQRVLAAQKLIKEKGAASNLNKTMEECGFSGRTTFYTAFQKYAGMTPAQFRKMVALEQAKIDN
jgi:tetratricopeptide (TPR) repeat protein